MRISDWSSDVCSSDLAQLLKRHRVRRITAAELLARLRAPAITVAPGTTEAASAHIQVLIKRLTLINRELRTARAKLDQLIGHLAAPEGSESGPQPEQRDVAILASSPGAGRNTIATLLAEIGRASCRERVCKYG